MLYNEIEKVINTVINNYITDLEISTLNEILNEKLLDDPNYNENDFVSDFDKICYHIKFYYGDYIINELNNITENYDNCLKIIVNNNFYDDWDKIAKEENNGKPFKNISQLVFYILLNNIYQNRIYFENLIAQKVYDLITP